MKKIKVIFFGCIDLSYTTLLNLIKIKYVEVVGVVTKKTSPINSDFFSLSTFCKEKKIDTFFFKPNVSKNLFDWIKEKRPGVILCVGWSHIIDSNILDLSEYYSIGYHPSDLPRNRGRHPLIWSLVLGLKKTASTFFELNKKVDSGDIINKSQIKIAKNDDINSLKKKLEKKIINQIPEIFYDIKERKLKKNKQKNLLANEWRKRNFSDGIIDWRMNAELIYNLVRALVKPFPGASIYYNGNQFKVWMVKISNLSPLNTEPGKVLSVINKNIHVKCGDKSIIITKHSFKSMPKKGDYLL